MVDPMEGLLRAVGAFDALGIPYFVGGSIASSEHGIKRTTMDADVVADMQSDQVEVFAAILHDGFYVDEEMIRDAIRRRSSFNILHLASGFKVDVFIPKKRAYEDQIWGRRVQRTIGSQLITVASAEDIILAKLEWYRLGNEVSSRQWGDVQVVIKVQAERLDRDYLRRWAGEIGVSDLLEKALAEAEL